MGNNRLKWILASVLVALLVVVLINSDSSTERTPTAPAKQTDKGPEGPARPEPSTEIASSDTMTETLKTVQAQYGAQRRRNEALSEQLERLQSELNRIEQKTEEDDPGADRDQAQLRGEIGELREMITDMRASAGRNLDSMNLSDLGLGETLTQGYQLRAPEPEQTELGRSRSGDASVNEPASIHQGGRLQGYTRLTPLVRHDGVSSDAGQDLGGGRRSSLSLEASGGEGGSGGSGLGELTGKNTPFYTIPARSTLFDATAMTALIGRVPVSGQVVDPFPVKIILGNDNLAANGHHIPGLQGIILDGMAQGDWTLGCVNVRLSGGTYVFDDGTISHLNGTSSIDDSIEQGTASMFGNEDNQAIGYISDRQGVPCIRGQKITDAYKQAATMGFLGAAQGYAEARAEAERTTTTGANSGVVVQSVTGSATDFSRFGQAATGLERVMEIFQERFQDTFDAVYVAPGKEVAVHVTRDLHIVHQSKGNRISYDNDLGSSHALD